MDYIVQDVGPNRLLVPINKDDHFMAYQGYMTLTGKIQGLISAGCSAQESIGNKQQAGHTDEIMVTSLMHNMNNAGNIKHSTHQPLVITKNIDKSTPLLGLALGNREEVDCKIDFYRVSSYGVQEKFYTIELKGGVIVDLTTDFPHTVLQNEIDPQEHLSLRYRDIIWTHHSAGTSGYLSWGETESEG